MATPPEPSATPETEGGHSHITSDMFQEMIEKGLIAQDRRVELWDGRLHEKMARSNSQAAVQSAFIMALVRRLPPELFAGVDNPVRLDDTHLPVVDVIVARGAPLDFCDTRYPDERDVVLVVEVAVSSLPEDLGVRLSRYALTLPSTTYVVADVLHHQILVFTDPRPSDEAGKGEYATRVVVGRGDVIRLRLGGVEIEPIPWEDVMR